MAGFFRLRPVTLRTLGGLSRRRQSLCVGFPVSSERAKACLPGRNPSPRGSCKGCRLQPATRLIPPAPLRMAEETLVFFRNIEFLPFFVELPCRVGCPGIGEVWIHFVLQTEKDRKTNSFSRFCGLYSLYLFFVTPAEHILPPTVWITRQPLDKPQLPNNIQT